MSDHKHKPFIRPAGKLSQQDFARLVATEQFTALDRLGNKIIRGSLVAYRSPFDTIFQVTDIVPVLDPRSPTPLVRLILTATFPVVCRVNQLEMPLIWVGQMQTAEDDAKQRTNGQGETPPVDSAQGSTVDGTDPVSTAGDGEKPVLAGPDAGVPTRSLDRDERPSIIQLTDLDRGKGDPSDSER